MNQSPPPSSVPTKASAPTAQAMKAGEQLAHDSKRFVEISVYLTPEWCAEIIDREAHLPALLAVVQAAERLCETLYRGLRAPNEKMYEWQAEHDVRAENLKQSVAAYRAVVGKEQT